MDGDSIFKYVHTIRSQTETNFDDHFIQGTFFTILRESQHCTRLQTFVKFPGLQISDFGD